MRLRGQVALVVSAMTVTLLLFSGLTACAPCGVLPIPGAGPEIEVWAERDVIGAGECTAIHWEVGGAEDYPIFFDGREVPSSGEEEVCLQETTTFELVVAAPSGSVRQTVTIRVEGEPPPEEPGPEEEPPEGGPEHIMLVVEPEVIPQGGCAMLRWEVAPGEWPVFINGEEVPPFGEREECPEGTVTYELLVEAPGGPQERTVTLHVEGGAEPPPAQATATQPPPAQATATQPPPAQPTATQPPPAQPTATPTTFVPVWGQCTWVKVHPTINSCLLYTSDAADE